MRQNGIKQAALISVLVYSVAVFGTMAMMSIAAGFVMAVFLVMLVRHEISLKPILYSPLFKATTALSIACVASLVWARFTGLEYYGFKPDIHFVHDIGKLWHLWFNLILFSMLAYLGKESVLKAIRVWLAAAFASSIFAIVQYYFPVYNPMLLPHVTYDSYVPAKGLAGLLQGHYHATGLAGFHLSFASILAFPTGMWLASTFRKKTPFMIFGSVLFVIANILTYSKTTWAVIPLMLIGFFVIGLHGFRRYAAVAVVLVLVLLGMNTSEFRSRFQGIDTVKERATLWAANFDMIAKYPVLGVGWHHNSDLSEAYYKEKHLVADGGNDIRPFISHAHNNFIDQTSSTGFVGLACYLWWNFILLLITFRIYRSQKDSTVFKVFAMGMLAGWFCLHLGGMTQTNFWDAKVMHQLSWVTAMTLAISALVYEENHSGRKVRG